jgi:hypothetical protein
MADRTLKAFNVVTGLTPVNTDSAPIPAGKRIRVLKVGGSDQNLGGNQSSLFVFQWGTVGAFQEIAVFALSGAAVEFETKEEFVGDGVKFFRLTRVSGIATAKRIMIWMKGYDF